MSDLIETGVEWIGDIPSNWNIERLQWHLEEVIEKNNPIKTKNILSLTNRLGVVPYSKKGNQGNVAKENYDEYKIAYPDTIVANSMNILIGSVGYCNYLGCVSPVYYVFKAKDNNDIKFFNYIFQTQQFQKELRKYASGILEIRLRVSSSDILKRVVPVPSYETQKLIVKSLEEKLSQIDTLIANQENQIEKLNEYKQAVITKAVTKGLDSYTCMKESGVESIGFIPESWKLLRSKYIFDAFLKGSEVSKEQVAENGDTKCIRYGEIYTKYDISFTDCYSKTRKDLISSKQYAEYGDLLFSATGELVEEIGKNIVYLGNERILVGGDIIVGKHHEDPEFLNYALYSSASQMQKSKGKAKLKVVHISAAAIGNVVVALPSSKEEQQEIKNYLNEKIEKIKKLIEVKNRKIDKLQDYKKTLIYEYVTGKRSVA